MAALRADGAARRDPLRWHFIEALARRAHGHDGPARQLIDARLDRALAECRARLQASAEAPAGAPGGDISGHPAGGVVIGRPAGGVASGRPAGGPLAALLRHADAQSAAMAAAVDPTADPADSTGTTTPPGPGSASAELKALRWFRRTWSRLSADRALQQSLAQAPAQAGPLNSHRLALRSLQRMRELSPAYLERFTGYAEALLRLDDGGPGGPAAPGPSGSSAPGERGGRKSAGRAKAR